MIALYILLGVVGLVTAICLLRFRFFATYTDTLTVNLKLLWFTFTVIPESERKKKRKARKKQRRLKKQQKQQANKEASLSYIEEQSGVDGLVSILKDLAISLKEIIRYVNIKKFDINITVRGADAADTAIQYGRVCSAVYTAVAAILYAAKFKEYNLNIVPDFDEEKSTDINCQVNFNVRFIYIIRYLLGVYIRIYKAGYDI